MLKLTRSQKLSTIRKELQNSSRAAWSDEIQEKGIQRSEARFNDCEYVTRFTQLSHYAPDNVGTDEKKQDWFLNGRNDGLAYALEAHNFDNF
jgi:hypothetical protein